MENYLAIPYSIFKIKEINLTSRVLLAEIISLSKKDRVCFASNEFLSERLGLSERCIAKLINDLREKGYIFCERKGRKRYINPNREKLKYENCSVKTMDENCSLMDEHCSEKDEHCSTITEQNSQYNNNYNNKYKNNYNDNKNSFNRFGYDLKRNYDINELMRIQ